MPEPFRTTRLVQFHETDAAGIAHFSAFFTYMEEAEHAMLRHLGLSVMFEDDDGRLSWPRVAVTCEFSGSVRFEDVVDVAVVVERLGKKSATYAFEFTHADQAIAQGHMTSVCCRLRPGLAPEPVEIPEWFREKLA